MIILSPAECLFNAAVSAVEVGDATSVAKTGDSKYNDYISPYEKEEKPKDTVALRGENT